MVFSSLIFLYGFFPESIIIYKLCKTKKAQNISLLIFSLIFYTWGEPKYLLLLMFMAMSSWIFARLIEDASDNSSKRLWLFLSCAVDILLIAYFKYAGFFISIFTEVPDFISKIALPIGISFYTFQLLTYVVDVYRGESHAQKSYWNVLLYAALFHQCIAGPIVRYKSIETELFGDEPRNEEFAPGVSRFAAGLAKKILLANPCGAVADMLLMAESSTASAAQINPAGSISVFGAWMGIIAYGLQIYLDFSAYSDMAIGMGRMLGLHYPENFNYPYISRSITEFWRRWHITLSSFFRDYVYIPLGGNRRGAARTFFNTLFVWLLTGLWHGASWNFVLWGLWSFVFISLERLFLKKILDKTPVFSHIYTLFVVFTGWVIFRFTDTGILFEIIKCMFGTNGNAVTDFAALTIVKNHAFLLIASVIACTPALKLLKQSLRSRVYSHGALASAWNVIFYSVIPVLLLLLSTAALVGESYNPFIYFRF